MTKDEARRYSRQMALPEIGVDGQRRLAAGRVLVAGLGGLGSIAAYYLAAAGVGYLKLIDRDRVTLENLNRQILHTSADLDRPKTEIDLFQEMDRDLIVEHNGRFVFPQDYAVIQVAPSDRVEFIHPNFGG